LDYPYQGRSSGVFEVCGEEGRQVGIQPLTVDVKISFGHNDEYFPFGLGWFNIHTPFVVK